MPIYEYRCRKCARQFEALQGMTDKDLKKCRYCNGPAEKMMSLSSFHLKGAGWYVTDYGGKKQSDKMKKEKESATAPVESKTEKTDTVPAAKEGKE